MTPTSLPRLRLGMAMWSHRSWGSLRMPTSAIPTSAMQTTAMPASLSQSQLRLAAYAQSFDTVEGNTTFYALPASHTVSGWNAATPSDFRFTFKLPSRITHELSLEHCRDEVLTFFQLMEPVMAKTALWKIQLPARFGPESLQTLADFIDSLPSDITVGVEARHRAFFAKGEAERALNRLLQARGANRIIMDTRPVFALPPASEAIIDAHNKKPRVPVHAIATGTMPVVRFIGQPVGMVQEASTDDAECHGGSNAYDGSNAHNGRMIKGNLAFFEPWVGKLIQWLKEGRSPYLFIHTPDNSDAPELARLLLTTLNQAVKLAEDQGVKCQMPALDNLNLGAAPTSQLGLW